MDWKKTLRPNRVKRSTNQIIQIIARFWASMDYADKHPISVEFQVAVEFEA